MNTTTINPLSVKIWHAVRYTHITLQGNVTVRVSTSQTTKPQLIHILQNNTRSILVQGTFPLHVQVFEGSEVTNSARQGWLYE